jgi:hypothetical protein
MRRHGSKGNLGVISSPWYSSSTGSRKRQLSFFDQGQIGAGRIIAT